MGASLREAGFTLDAAHDPAAIAEDQRRAIADAFGLPAEGDAHPLVEAGAEAWYRQRFAFPCRRPHDRPQRGGSRTPGLGARDPPATCAISVIVPRQRRPLRQPRRQTGQAACMSGLPSSGRQGKPDVFPPRRPAVNIRLHAASPGRVSQCPRHGGRGRPRQLTVSCTDIRLCHCRGRSSALVVSPTT